MTGVDLPFRYGPSRKIEFAPDTRTPDEIAAADAAWRASLQELDDRIAAEAARRGEIHPFTNLVENFHRFIAENTTFKT